MSATDKDMIVKAIVVYNPLDVSDRTEADLVWQTGKPLSHYLDGLPEEVEWEVALNKTYVPKEGHSLVFPKPGDEIIVTPVPQGGGGDGGGKQVLAVVAAVALGFFAPVLGTSLASAVTGSAVASGSFAALMGTAAVQAAGGILISALVPKPDNSNGEKAQTNFGIDGPKNTSVEAIPFPVLYGEHGWGGNYADLFTENTTDENGESVQYLYGRVIVSEGPVKSISGFQFNEQDADSFSEVEIDYRLGTLDQTVSNWFNDSISLIPDGRSMTTTEQTYKTSKPVDKVRLDVVLPEGLYVTSKGGSKRNKRAVGYTIRIRKVEQDGSPLGPWMDYTSNGVTRDFRIEDATANPVRRSYKSDKLEFGYYEISFRRHREEGEKGHPGDIDVKDKIVVSDVGEILLDDFTLPGTAWAGFRARLTDQFNSVPTFTGVAEGRIVPIYDHNGNKIADEYSDNPADIALDMMISERYGGSTELGRIDWAAHAEWRDACVEQNLTFNGIFNEVSNLYDEMKHVYIAGRAQRVTSGARLSVAIDGPSEPVMMFDSGNIVEDSFALNYLPITDRVNDIEVTYLSAVDNYRRQSVRQVNQAALDRGEPLKSTSIELKGVTNVARADREAVFRMNANNLIDRTAEWDSPIEALSCSVGDVVLVQHEMPRWSVGGRLAPGSTSSVLKLDREVELEAGETYKALLHLDKLLIAQPNIVSQTGNFLTVDTVIPNSGFALRAVHGGEDFAIERVIPGQGSTKILLENRAQSFALSGPIEIWRTDAIRSIDVTSPAGKHSEVSISTDFDPPAYANFIIGKTETVEKKFRITRIGRESSGIIPISAVEYDERVYSDDPITPTDEVPGSVIPHVENVFGEETLREIMPGVLESYARVTWTAPSTGEYLSAIVQYSVNDGPWSELLKTTNFEAEVKGEIGDVIKMRVVAVTAAGIASEKFAPVATIPLDGKTDPPAVPTGWTLMKGGATHTLEGDKHPDPDFKEFGIYLRRLSGGERQLIATTPANAYVRSTEGDNDDPVIYYEITAFDTTGNESEPFIINAGDVDTSHFVNSLLDEFDGVFVKHDEALEDLESGVIFNLLKEYRIDNAILAAQDVIDGGRAVVNQEAYENNQAAIIQEQTVRADEDEALAQTFTGLLATYQSDTNAAIAAEQTARANADTAIASDVTSLSTRMGSAEGNISNIQATKVSASQAVSAVEQTISANYGSMSAMASATSFAKAQADKIAAGFVWRLNGQNLLELVSVANGTNGPTSTYKIAADYVEITGNLKAGNTTAGVVINTAQANNAVYVYQNSTSTYAIYATNNQFSGGTTQMTSLGGFTAQFINQTNGSGSFGAFCAIDAQHSSAGGGKAKIGVAATGGGYGVEVYSGGYYDSSGDGYLPFTGKHEGMIAKTETFEIGDIVVDDQIVAKSLSDVFTEFKVSDRENMPNAVGVIASVSAEWYNPASFIVQPGHDPNFEPTPLNPAPDQVTKIDTADYSSNYNMAVVNSVGEGCVNVCGRGGDISAGDLICTSSMKGKGQRQADDFVRSRTVAKARESVVFSSADEVKQIACIYMCG